MGKQTEDFHGVYSSSDFGGGGRATEMKRVVFIPLCLFAQRIIFGILLFTFNFDTLLLPMCDERRDKRNGAKF